MRRFRSWDGTALAYHVVGSGPPLVCVPGGPGQAGEYLGELGGLSARRTLIILDNRGTGASGLPEDQTTYRVDRLVADVEALRWHLGLDRMDLFGHSASGGVCLLYAVAHPEAVRRLVLVGPSLRVVGIESDLGLREVLAERQHEPWYAQAVPALTAHAHSDEDLWLYRWQSSPLLYGRWNASARAHAAAARGQFAGPATDWFYRDFTPDPALRDRLAELPVPALLVVGEHDIWPTRTAVRELAGLLERAELVVQPEAGHFPWVDDPTAFTDTVDRFLGQRRRAPRDREPCPESHPPGQLTGPPEPQISD